MVAEFSPTAVSTPAVLTSATAVLEELQLTLAVIFCWLLSEYVPVAVYCCTLLSGNDTFAGLIAIETSVITVKFTPLLLTPLA
jgi:hypothetical protein